MFEPIGSMVTATYGNIPATAKQRVATAGADDEAIEQLARGICRHLGLDPDERIALSGSDDETPAELALRAGPGGLTVTMDWQAHGPRWRMFRRDAALALATRAALAEL